MKKILSLGIASAVLAMTALSASAGVVVRTDDKVTTGATIRVDVVADSNISNISFKTTAVGLTLVDASSSFITGDPNEVIVIGDNKDTFVAVGLGARANEVIFSQTYTVTATEGQSISVNIENLEGTTGNTPLTAIVTAVTSEPTSTPEESKPEESKPEESTPTESTPTESTPTESTPAESTPGIGGPGDDNNPETGIALAIFPAVIAGAAVVVAKKKRG